MPELLEDTGTIGRNMVVLLETLDPTIITSLVSPKGLVIAPYGVGAPEQGLTGERLARTLNSLFSGSDFKVLKYESTDPSRINMIVTGLNAVRIQPAVGEYVTMTNRAFISWRLEDDNAWRLWLLVVDQDELLAEALELPKIEMTESTMSDENAFGIISMLVELMVNSEIRALAEMVQPNGLVLVPYAVGTPEQGLTGESLAEALKAVLQGASPKVVAYDNHMEGRLSFAVKGLNPVQIKPAVGDVLTISSPAIVELGQNSDGTWELWAIVVDDDVLLSEAIAKPPYKEWE